MRDVRRLVILDWLLSGTGERWTDARRPPVRGGPGAGQGDPGEPADRPARGRCAARCRNATAPRRRPRARWPRTPPTTGCWSAWTPVSPRPPRSVRIWAPRSATWSTRRSARPTRAIRGSSRADIEVTVRDLAAVYAHVERAVADQDGRVRLEGDIAAVRRVANALQVGMAGETHFLFGDDRFGPWGAEFERAAARDGLQPQDPVTVGQIRGWIDAIRPELGLRDEVADLVMLAWAALRQRAWYQHGGSIPAPRPGAPGPDMELRPEPLPAPGDWQAATSRAESLFGIRVNPYLTAAGLAELTGSIRSTSTPWPTRPPCSVAADRTPTSTSACAEGAGAGWRPPAPRPLWLRRLQRAEQPGPPGRDPGPGRPLPATETAVANSLQSGGIGIRRAGRVPVGPARPAARGRVRDRSARPRGGRHPAGPAGGGRPRTSSRPGSDRPCRRPTMRSSSGWPSGQPRAGGRAPARARPDDVASPLPPPLPSGGRATRAKGAPASDVLEPLAEFLDAHRDKQVVVEWRVQE